VAQVKFVKQERADRIPLICQLCEQLFLDGLGKEKILILVDDDNQALALDRLLWTWNKLSFLPHAYDNGAVECFREPIIITTREDSHNAAATLIMGRPCSLDFVKKFKQVIDFAEVYDADLVERSRQRYRIYRDHGLNPEMLE
jgi:DNA polymerase-3 subunit chi